MPRLSLIEGTAINRIASVLDRSVTTANIDEVARWAGFELTGSKNTKLCSLFEALVTEGRAPSKLTTVIFTLVHDAHRRTVAGKAEMTEDDVDSIVADMRTLRLDVGDLRKTEWRRGLQPSASRSVSARAEPSPPLGRTLRPVPLGIQPQCHEDAITFLAELTDNPNAQRRGLELERLVHHVLAKETLRPQGNIISPGVQIDLGFQADGQHYLMEVRWKKEPQGMPDLREFMEKVRRMAEGTFGVILSMSGFVSTINETASLGVRLNCVGLTHVDLISVLEGRTTFYALIRHARSEASTRGRFLHSG